jgi:hypothetical protein
VKLIRSPTASMLFFQISLAAREN